MSQVPSIDYGSQVQADLSGTRAMEGAVEEHGQKLVSAERGLGNAAEGTAATYTQNVLHRQSVDAAAKAAEGTEAALNTIETHPYVMTRDELAGAVDPETAEALWQKAVASGEIDREKDPKTGSVISETVPTHVIGRDLYSVMAKKAREDAAQAISLPGWRAEFLKSAEVEALNKQERWLDPKLAMHQVAYDRWKTDKSIRTQADLARAPEDFELPLAAVRTSPSFSPQEKEEREKMLLARKDTVIIDRAMTNPVLNEGTLQQELTKLQGSDAAKFYPNHDEKGRSELVRHVETGLHMAKLQKDEQDRLAEKADKQNDESLNAFLMNGLLQGKINPDKMFAQSPGDTNANFAVWDNYKTFEGREKAFHALRAFQEVEKQANEKDAPGAYQAISYLRMTDPLKFRDAMFANSPVKVMGREYNFSHDLSRESARHFFEQAANLGDKQRSEEDRVKEEALERRLTMAITSPEGGGIDATDWKNSRTEYAEHEQFVRDALTNAQKDAVRNGKRLNTAEENDVMLKAAQTFKASYDTHFFSPDGVSIKADSGNYTLPLRERVAVDKARLDSGRYGVADYQTEGKDYYDNYKSVIEQSWDNLLKSEPKSTEALWRIYYESKNLAQVGIVDPKAQVSNIMAQLAAANAMKKTGGSK